MNILDRVIEAFSPRMAAARERDRTVAMHYRASRLGHRNEGIRASGADADLASRDRRKISFYARDMIRNTPMASRIQDVIAGHVVGDGILPKLHLSSAVPATVAKRLKARSLEVIEQHCDSVDIDRNGLLNLYGLQALAMNTIVDSGEVLIRRHRRLDKAQTIPLEIEILEPDYIDESRYGVTPDGNEVREGIEYDSNGDRVAYWLYMQHPGGEWRPGRNPMQTERVDAADILHVFRLDRPGQTRGISWLTKIAEKLLNADDAENAHLMRQKIAACFVAFHHMDMNGKERPELGGTMQPGAIMQVGVGEEITIADPPQVGDWSEFQKSVYRAAAMGVGLTYEALTGDLSGVNFSSARIGRLEMSRNISRWQWLMLVPQMLNPLGRWIIEAWAEAEVPEFFEIPGAARFIWVPPHQVIVDPAREFQALREAVRSGFMSRQGVIRTLGVDPERLIEEQLQDKEIADRLGLPFDSDPRADVSRQSSSFTETDKEYRNE
ncbi:phage portal protein [Pseudomonas sp. GX19020]|uniref:phage portal protein n=1 Tax=Pseudomonas sp. GX19020 TaxID=2942277 RepID=UPI0020195CE4|nr:phage portal protein [Pseudomonas sp. GX19020]MCL4069008.1 phage portal protein [Pseudomonas sp. GX19020]